MNMNNMNIKSSYIKTQNTWIINLNNILNPHNKVLNTLLKQSVSEVTFIIFDLETTGGNPQKNGITEISAIKYKNNKILDSFYTLVNPKKRISKIVTKITGIDNNLLRGQPYIEEVFPKFLKFIENGVLVSHNILSDISFIKYFLHKILNINFHNIFLCTHILSTKLFKDASDKSLSGLAHYLNIENPRAHRAQNDAKVTLEIFKKILEQLMSLGLQTLDDVIKFQGNYHLLSKIQTKIPKKILNNIPTQPGLISFIDRHDCVIFVTSSLNLRKDLNKLENSTQLTKKIHKIIVNASKIKLTVYKSYFNATIDEYHIRQTLTYPSYKWHNNKIILGLVLSLEQKLNSFLFQHKPIDTQTIAAIGPVYSNKYAKQILGHIAESLNLSFYKNNSIIIKDHLVQIFKKFLSNTIYPYEYYILLIKKFLYFYNSKQFLRIQEQINCLKTLLKSRVLLQFSSLLNIHGILFVNSEQDINKKDIYFVINSIPIYLNMQTDNIQKFLKNKKYIHLFKTYLKKYKYNYNLKEDLNVDMCNTFLWLYYSNYFLKNHDIILIIYKNRRFYEYH